MRLCGRSNVFRATSLSTRTAASKSQYTFTCAQVPYAFCPRTLRFQPKAFHLRKRFVRRPPGYVDDFPRRTLRVQIPAGTLGFHTESLQKFNGFVPKPHGFADSPSAALSRELFCKVERLETLRFHAGIHAPESRGERDIRRGPICHRSNAPARETNRFPRNPGASTQNLTKTYTNPPETPGSRGSRTPSHAKPLRTCELASDCP